MMPSLSWLVTVAVSMTVGGLLVAIKRTKRETDIADLHAPKCRVCHGTGAHATNELRPRLLFCNFCDDGQVLEDRAARGAMVAPARPDRPTGGAA